MQGVRNDAAPEGEQAPDPASAEGEPQGEQTEGETPPEGEAEGKVDYKGIPDEEILGGLEVPEGMEIGLDRENKAFQFWSEFAEKNGISKDDYVAGIQSFIQQQIADAGDPAQEIAKIGDNGQQVVDQVDHWLSETLKRHFGSSESGIREAQGHYEALANSLTSAESIKAINVLREAAMNTGVPANPGGQGGTAEPMTMDKVREMMNDERYRNPMKRDQNYVDQVRKATEAAVKAGQ